MTEPLDNRAFTYTLTEEGDLLLSGVMPDYPYPSAAPWYADRSRIRRVVTERGSRVGANAFTGAPVLRAVDLTGATEVGDRAFCDCGRLASLVLSPSIKRIAGTAFGGCRNLFLLDFAGSEETLLSLIARTSLSPSALCLRTPPTPRGEVTASGEIGGGSWSLTADGVLTLEDAHVPDYLSPQDAPWHPHREEIRQLVVGEGVTRVGDRAFFGMPSLTGVTVAGRAEIGQSAFASCMSLKEAAVFGSVTSIGPYAFAGTGLEVALMPPSLRRVPMGLYDSCRALRMLVLPPVGITEAAAFTQGCRSLLRVILLGTKEEYLELRELGLSHAGRAVLLPHPPLPEELDAALKEAEEVEAAVAESFDTATLAITAITTRLGELPERVRAAEAAYMTAETRRTGFAEPTAEEEEAAERAKKRPSRLSRRSRGRFAGWRWLRKSRITYAEEERLQKKWRRLTARATEDETRREKETAREVDEAMHEICLRLEALTRLVALHEKNTELAHRRAELCLRAADEIYPYERAKREAADARVEAADSIPRLPHSGALKLASIRAATYRELFSYHRYAEVLAGIEELKEILSGVKAETEKQKEADTFRPRILVAGGDPGEDPATDACMRALHRAGAIPIAAPLSLLSRISPTPLIPRRNHHDSLLPKKDVDRGFDALVICGEGTVDPFLYNERRDSRRDTRRSKKRTPLEVDRDVRDYDLFSAFYRYGKPVLGINRGCQLINVAQGGTLYRELGDKRLPHHFSEVRDARGVRKDVIHELRIDPASFLFAIYRPTVRPVRVYSRHQGAIRELGRELLPIARTKDETIEAFAHRSLPVAGVQFSVERMVHPACELRAPIHSIPDDGAPLFDWFLTLCRNIRRRPLVSSANDRFSTGDE